jgi:hypothetical protein
MVYIVNSPRTRLDLARIDLQLGFVRHGTSGGVTTFPIHVKPQLRRKNLPTVLAQTGRSQGAMLARTSTYHQSHSRSNKGSSILPGFISTDRPIEGLPPSPTSLNVLWYHNTHYNDKKYESRRYPELGSCISPLPIEANSSGPYPPIVISQENIFRVFLQLFGLCDLDFSP